MESWANGVEGEIRSIGGLNYEYNARQKRWKIASASASPNPNATFNSDAFTARSVRPVKIDLGVTGFMINTPPIAPSDGDIYIIGPAATGVFAGHYNDIAMYSSRTGEYTFTHPYVGFAVIDPSSRSLLTWNGSAYEPVGLAATAALQPFEAVDYVITGAAVDFNGNAPLMPDGFATVVGQRIGVVSHVLPVRNGIYVVVTPGSGSNGVWVRAIDADQQSEMRPGRAFFVKEGANLKGASYSLINATAPVVGVDAITFGQTGAGGIPNAAVTTPKIANAAVTREKIENGAIGADQIAAASVATQHLAVGAVTSNRLADGAVTTSKIADTTITTSKLADGAIATSKIADAAVTLAKLADLAAATVMGAQTVGPPVAMPMTTLATLLAANATAKETLRAAVGGINTAHGAIGAICFAEYSTATARAPGFQVAGSALSPCAIVGYGSGGNSFITTSGVLTGTWELLGSLAAASGLLQASMWRRVA